MKGKIRSCWVARKFFINHFQLLFLYQRIGRTLCLYSLLGEEQKVSAGVSVPSAGTSNWCRAFWKHSLRPMWAQLEITCSVWFCRVVTSVAFWPALKNWMVREACFQVVSYTGNVLPGKGKETFLLLDQTSKVRALIASRFLNDFGQPHQWCSAGHYFSIRQFLACWYAIVHGNYSVLKKHLKFFHRFLKSCRSNSCGCYPLFFVCLFFHLRTGTLYRKGILTTN